MNQTNRNMLEGPLFPNIIRFTIPIILTSVLQLLFNAADLVVVGQFCGSVYVAAVGATGSITGLLVNFFIGLSVGAGVAVAHGLGGRENEVVHRTVHTALPTAILSGAILTVAGLTYSETFLIMMGTPDTVLPLSTVYMRIIFCGVTFNMVYNFCASILRAAGDTKSPLVFLLFAGVLNVILNLVFVIQFQMNVAGVALATIISQAVSAVLVVIALMRRTDACKLYLNKLRFYKPQLAKILRIGLPAGIQSALFAISNVLIQSSVTPSVMFSCPATRRQATLRASSMSVSMRSTSPPSILSGRTPARNSTAGCGRPCGSVWGALRWWDWCLGRWSTCSAPRCSPFTSPTPRKPSPMA